MDDYTEGDCITIAIDVFRIADIPFATDILFMDFCEQEFQDHINWGYFFHCYACKFGGWKALEYEEFIDKLGGRGVIELINRMEKLFAAKVNS